MWLLPIGDERCVAHASLCIDTHASCARIYRDNACPLDNVEHHQLLLLFKALTDATYLSTQLASAHLLNNLVTYSHRASAAACMIADMNCCLPQPILGIQNAHSSRNTKNVVCARKECSPLLLCCTLFSGAW